MICRIKTFLIVKVYSFKVAPIHTLSNFRALMTENPSFCGPHQSVVSDSQIQYFKSLQGTFLCHTSHISLILRERRLNHCVLVSGKWLSLESDSSPSIGSPSPSMQLIAQISKEQVWSFRMLQIYMQITQFGLIAYILLTLKS